MPKISISVAEPVRNIEAVKLIRSVTGLSVGSIEARLADGKRGIFYTAELFLNDHVDVDRAIRKLLDGLHLLGIEPFVLEIGSDEAWEDVSDFDAIRIPAEELINTLDSAVGRFR